MTTLDPPAPSRWDDRIRQAHAAYPSTASGIDADKTRALVDGEEVIVRLLRVVFGVDNVAVRRGTRPVVDPEEGRRMLRELRGQDYTVEPFPVAFRALAGGRSLENLKRRTSLSRTNLSRLLNGQKQPRPAEMEAIAVGFQKQPMYFAEYRAATFAALVQAHLAQDPDRSAVLAQRLGL